MLRKNEIIEAGIDYTMSTRPICIGGSAFAEDMRNFNRDRSFEAGAEWAVRTMNERIRNKIQESVCDNYFEMHADFIDEFCKELMEE